MSRSAIPALNSVFLNPIPALNFRINPTPIRARARGILP
jgi:hypothetical protein